MLKVEKKAIELRVNTLKQLIDDLNLGKRYCLKSDREVSLKVVKINPDDIPNFSNYPYDYQYFVSVIGGRLSLGFGYAMLEVITPELYNVEVLEGDYHDELAMLRGDFPMNSLLVANYPCHDDTIAFDQSTIPYSTINGWGDTYDFLDFIEGQFLRLPENLSYNVTSNGVHFSDILEHARDKVEWIEGCHSFNGQLPSLDELPIPAILYQLPALHPDRPRGSRAMICAHGAKGRLIGLRAGAWTVTPMNDWRYAIFPDGDVGWIPKELDLPQALFVNFTNDIN